MNPPQLSADVLPSALIITLKKKKNIKKKYTLLNVTLNYISLVKVLKASYVFVFHCK